jgi:hypothetical protein
MSGAKAGRYGNGGANGLGFSVSLKACGARVLGLLTVWPPSVAVVDSGR